MSNVLCIPRNNIHISDGYTTELIEIVDSKIMFCSCWMNRELVESDPGHLQVIPYVTIERADGAILTYRRPESGGDSRLSGYRSLGLGGHIELDKDGPDPYRAFINCCQRELDEEIGLFLTTDVLDAARPAGYIFDSSSDVGRVHLGFHVRLKLDNPVVRPSAEVVDPQFMATAQVFDIAPELENWSQSVFFHLQGLAQ